MNNCYKAKNTVHINMISFQFLMETPKFPKMPNIHIKWKNASIKNMESWF